MFAELNFQSLYDSNRTGEVTREIDGLPNTQRFKGSLHPRHGNAPYPVLIWIYFII